MSTAIFVFCLLLGAIMFIITLVISRSKLSSYSFSGVISIGALLLLVYVGIVFGAYASLNVWQTNRECQIATSTRILKENPTISPSRLVELTNSLCQ